MAKKKNGPSKTEQIRQLLKANPKIGAKEAVSTLAAKGVSISEHLYYYTRGHMKGRKKKARKIVATVVAATGTTKSDAVSTILKVKGWANEVGGLKHLKALVDALSQ